MRRETRGAFDDAGRLERVVALLADPNVYGLRYEWATSGTARRRSSAAPATVSRSPPP